MPECHRTNAHLFFFHKNRHESFPGRNCAKYAPILLLLSERLAKGMFMQFAMSDLRILSHFAISKFKVSYRYRVQSTDYACATIISCLAWHLHALVEFELHLAGVTPTKRREENKMFREDKQGESLGPPGRDTGRRGGLVSTGSDGHCLCPKCNYKEPHERGKPCRSKECPQCGTRMIRE